MKLKAFFIIFPGLSVARNCLRPETAPLTILAINPHMHKMGPRGPKHYIFGDQFYSKNARMLRFHEFLHFYARKHMIILPEVD